VNILFFEDKGSVSTYVGEALERAGHRIFFAFNVNDAQSHWEDEAIDAIILDLSVDPEGLTEDQKRKTDGGLFTGWIWLHENVLAARPEVKARTIILTEYREDLVKAVPPAELKNVTLLWKREEGYMTKLLAAIAVIQAKLK